MNIKNVNRNTKENLYSSFRVSFRMSWIEFNVTIRHGESARGGQKGQNGVFLRGFTISLRLIRRSRTILTISLRLPARPLTGSSCLPDKLTIPFIARLAPFFRGTKRKDRIKGDDIIFRKGVFFV